MLWTLPLLHFLYEHVILRLGTVNGTYEWKLRLWEEPYQFYKPMEDVMLRPCKCYLLQV
jgi:hypothetical protein